MTLTIEYERAEDGRWLAEVLEIPGVLVYGETSEEVLRKVQARALRTVADHVEHCPGKSDLVSVSFTIA